MRRRAAMVDHAPNEARTMQTPGDAGGDPTGRADRRRAPFRSPAVPAFAVAVRGVVPATLPPLAAADAPPRRRRSGPHRAAALLETLDA
jgi:hypothetical protein